LRPVISLVLGGARSGKSEVAERLLEGSQAVTFIATAVDDGGDPDLAARIALHRQRRPEGWTTIEVRSGDLAGAVQQAAAGPVLVDSLSTWVAAGAGFGVDFDGLCAALSAREGDVVVVSDEVGLGVHPSSEAGRRFRDQLGLLNQAVAAVADRVLLVVAGRVLPLEQL
jgi:nicotinate-nucleotide--dimethylbenzimidazole phosphoribosyltransferase